MMGTHQYIVHVIRQRLLCRCQKGRRARFGARALSAPLRRRQRRTDVRACAALHSQHRPLLSAQQNTKPTKQQQPQATGRDAPAVGDGRGLPAAVCSADAVRSARDQDCAEVAAVQADALAQQQFAKLQQRAAGGALPGAAAVTATVASPAAAPPAPAAAEALGPLQKQQQQQRQQQRPASAFAAMDAQAAHLAALAAASTGPAAGARAKSLGAFGAVQGLGAAGAGAAPAAMDMGQLLSSFPDAALPLTGGLAPAASAPQPSPRRPRAPPARAALGGAASAQAPPPRSPLPSPSRPPPPLAAHGSHRLLLRTHSSSPVPGSAHGLRSSGSGGSGAGAGGIARMPSGDWVVEIAPPTRITTRVSFSTDPSAAFALDAASSGGLPPPSPLPGAAAAAAAGAAGGGTSGAGMRSHGHAAGAAVVGDGLASAGSSSGGAGDAGGWLPLEAAVPSQGRCLGGNAPSAGASGSSSSTSSSGSINSSASAQPAGGVSCTVGAETAAAAAAAAAAAVGGAPGKALDPRSYYEAVPPSTWRPGNGDDDAGCLELHRRAHCGRADAAFPPLWAAGVAALAWSRLLPFWLLAVVAAASLAFGLRFAARRLAGVASPREAAARAAPSLVLSLEVLYTAVVAVGMLPEAWMGLAGTGAATLIACCGALYFHARAALMDPGRIPLPATARSCAAEVSEDGGAAAGAAAALLPLAAVTGAAAAVTVHGKGAVDSGGGGAASGAPGRLAAAPPLCWTCGVARELRSKHCARCGRCCRRFSHHCLVVGNCVGEGNQREFVAYLASMFAAQCLFVSLATGLLVRSGASISGGGGAGALRALWAARAAHPGWLLLLLLQAPLLPLAGAQLARALLLAAANLTLNEWANRRRYAYLQHPAAGLCNRFDRGPAHNLFEFLSTSPPPPPPQGSSSGSSSGSGGDGSASGGGWRDWQATWDEGEREMAAAGRTLLARGSLTALARRADAAWARWRAALMESRRRAFEARVERRMRALGLDPSAGRRANGVGGCGAGGGPAGGGGCTRCEALH